MATELLIEGNLGDNIYVLMICYPDMNKRNASQMKYVNFSRNK